MFEQAQKLTQYAFYQPHVAVAFWSVNWDNDNVLVSVRFYDDSETVFELSPEKLELFDDTLLNLFVGQKLHRLSSC